MTKVLVVDDEVTLARALTINLVARNMEAQSVSTGSAALRAVAQWHPDVVVLDLGLPDIDGLQVLAGIRGWSSVPVVVLSARATSTEKVEALDAGADDYVTKPFEMNELIARIGAAARRGVLTGGGPEAIVRAPDFEVDLSSGQVMRDGLVVRLTPTQWHVLEVLAKHADKLVPSAVLLEQVWGPGYERQTHYLRIYVSQLRQRLEPDPAHPRNLITEPGLGYRLISHHDGVAEAT